MLKKVFIGVGIVIALVVVLTLATIVISNNKYKQDCLTELDRELNTPDSFQKGLQTEGVNYLPVGCDANDPEVIAKENQLNTKKYHAVDPNLYLTK